MKSRRTEGFLACFAGLPDEVKDRARKCYRLWEDAPFSSGPALQANPSSRAMYSVRVSKGWRVLGLLEGDTVTWFWIGSHAEYDQLIR